MAGLTTQGQLAKLIAKVGVALRYGPSASLPLTSVYEVVARPGEPEAEAQRRATKLTNAVIDAEQAIETNAIADRLTLVSPALAPALVALARRHRELSDTAERVLGYIAHADRPTAGQVRAFVGAPKTWPNPADEALAELQRKALIDRGATATPETGAAYLGKDGIPYRIFDRAHPRIVKASKKLGVVEAARQLVGALPGVPEKKLTSMFKRLLSRDEIHVLFTHA